MLAVAENIPVGNGTMSSKLAASLTNTPVSAELDMST